MVSSAKFTTKNQLHAAYPVNLEDKRTVTLDNKCKFCQDNKNEDMTGLTGRQIWFRKGSASPKKNPEVYAG